jgi:hypothetical protein
MAALPELLLRSRAARAERGASAGPAAAEATAATADEGLLDAALVAVAGEDASGGQAEDPDQMRLF